MGSSSSKSSFRLVPSDASKSLPPVTFETEGEVVNVHTNLASSNGVILYHVSRTHGYSLSLSYSNPKFVELRNQLQVGMAYRFVVTESTTQLSDHHSYHELVDIKPLQVHRLTGSIDGSIMYTKEMVEVILEQRPLKVSQDKDYAMLVMNTERFNVLPKHVPVQLALQYHGKASRYQIVEVSLIK